MRLSWEKHLAELEIPGKAASSRSLVSLSGLSSEQLRILKSRWPQIALQRRAEIIRRLRELGEDNLALDFEGVYRMCLTDPSAEVRAKAVIGLAASEDYAVVAPLIALLKEDPSSAVRASAAITLGRFALLAELQKLQPDYAARIEAALLDVINRPVEDNEVRRRAVESIGPLNTPRVADAIRRAYESTDPKMRASAIYAMGQHCHPEWLPILIEELSSPHTEIRFEAAGACGELEDEAAVPYLKALVDDPDSEVQLAATDALGQIGGREAEEILYRCLESEDIAVREAAREALQVIEFGNDPFSLRRRLDSNGSDES